MKINLDTTMFTVMDEQVLIRPTEDGQNDILIPLKEVEFFKQQIDYAIELNTDGTYTLDVGKRFSILNLRGFRRMLQTYHAYKLVKLVKKQMQAYETLNPDTVESEVIWYPEIAVTNRQYAKDMGFSAHQVKLVNEFANRKEYVFDAEDEMGKEVYRIEPDGYDLIESYRFFPGYGLVKAALHDAGPVYSVIFTVVSSGILILLWHLLGYIIKGL